MVSLRVLARAYRAAGVAGALVLMGLLAGCGGSSSATLYVLFDASQSSSQLIREGHRDNAVLTGSAFCRRHPGSGEIIFNVITPSPEADSRFHSLQCPERKNETDFRAKMLVFEPQLRAVVDDAIGAQALTQGSDIIGAILYGANQTFNRFKPEYRYLVVFSDMEQVSDGVSNCIEKKGETDAASCLSLYFGNNPQLNGKVPALQNTAVFVSGFGQTTSGSISDKKLTAYRAFWMSFFDREDAKVCWFAPTNMPVTTNSDGTQSINPKYFTSDCPPIPAS